MSLLIIKFSNLVLMKVPNTFAFFQRNLEDNSPVSKQC